MNVYAVLIRGINVGGKNKIPMADLRKCLEHIGFTNVSTYIASGNVFLSSDKQPDEVRKDIEEMLPKCFELDTELVRVLVLTRGQLNDIINNKPKGFGDHPELFHSDVIFLMGIDEDSALSVFSPKEGVDTIWPSKGVIYSQRLSERRTQSRLNKIIGTPAYQLMTIRNWNTTVALLANLEKQLV